VVEIYRFVRNDKSDNIEIARRAVSDWLFLLRKREPLYAWFTRIAERLLNRSRLVVRRRPYRLVEIEFYYWSKAHPDPFTHRDPIQFHSGHWYFHRTHGVYRGGSFKGLDLTFGQGDASGGILIRGLETPDGTLIDGPSLCVDHLLDVTGAATVAELDRTINKRLAWEDGNPLMLEAIDTPDDRPLFRSPRIGLSLKKNALRKEATRFILRPYRDLSEPRRTKKGKLLLVLALYAQGVDNELIQFKTNCPRRALERYIADFERGRKEADFTPFFGVDLGPAELGKLYGVWFAHWGFSGKTR
jgi:3-methyladenine DNA glycosylase Mpg